MRLRVGIEYYSDYDASTLIAHKNLQWKMKKMFVYEDLLNAPIFYFKKVERRKYILKQFLFQCKLLLISTYYYKQMKCHNFFNHDNNLKQYKTLTDHISSVNNTFQGFLSLGENTAVRPIIEANKNFTAENRNGITRLFSTISRKEIFPCSYYNFAKNVLHNWMNSPGHRANILNPDFEYLGCGCEKYERQNNGYSMLYFKLTQNFGGSLSGCSLSFENNPKHFKSLCFGQL